MEELVAKRNTFSPVWAFFGLKKDHEDDDKSVICRLCQAVVLAQGGNTRNLFSHLKVHHAREHTSIEENMKKDKSLANKDSRNSESR